MEQHIASGNFFGDDLESLKVILAREKELKGILEKREAHDYHDTVVDDILSQPIEVTDVDTGDSEDNTLDF